MRRNMTPQTEPTLDPPHGAHAAAPRRRVAFRAQLETLEDRVVLATWQPLGPAPIVLGQTAGRLDVSGRVTGVATDPKDANTIFIATAGGGVWKTFNGGQSWTPLTDNLTNSNNNPIPLFMGAIAETRGPANNQIVYAGTGVADNSQDSYPGVGIFVSYDGGSSWILRGSQFAGGAVAQIAIDPTDSTGQTVYAAISNSATNTNLPTASPGPT